MCDQQISVPVDRILAIDLGKRKSVACDYASATGAHTFTTVATAPAAMHDLIVERAPGVSRSGRITGRGNKLLRALLVEVSWLMRRYNSWLGEVFERVCRGSKTRRKIAVVAVTGPRVSRPRATENPPGGTPCRPTSPNSSKPCRT